MRPHAPMLALLLVVLVAACDDEGSDTSLQDTASSPDGLTDGEADRCASVTCGGHGTCRLDASNVLGTFCECEPGFVGTAVDCLALEPQPPAGLQCAAPGGDSETLLAELRDTWWTYTDNDRTCAVGGWEQWQLHSDGVVQGRIGRTSDRYPVGSVVWGCWSFASSSAEALVLDYTLHETTRNCGALGERADPPCQATLERRDSDTWQLVSSFDTGEVHVLRRMTGACSWCAQDPQACCAEPGWIADSSGPICP